MSGLDPYQTLNHITDEISKLTRKLGLVCESLYGPAGIRVKPFHVRRSKNDLAIVVPPMHYIPISEETLVDTLAERLQGREQDRFRELVRQLNMATGSLYFHQRQYLLRLFEPFAAAADRRTVLVKQGAELSDADLDQAELELLREVLVMMSGANYNILTGVEWQAALAEAYLITMPVEVKHEGVSDELIRKLWTESHQKFAMLLPEEIRDRMLVFHRGLTQLRMRKRHLGLKLDLLFQYTLEWAGRWVLWLFLRLVTCGRYPPVTVWMPALDQLAKDMAADTDSDWLEGRMGVEVAKDKLLGKLADLEAGAAEPRGESRSKKDDDGIDEAEMAGVSYRRTIHRALPTMWSVLRNFFKEIDMYEPSFQEMVIVYRRRVVDEKAESREQVMRTSSLRARLETDKDRALNGAASKPGKGSKGGKQKLEAVLDTIEGEVEEMQMHKHTYNFRRNIFIKSFKQVPLADLEPVMPDKVIHFDARTLFSIWASIIVGIIVGIYTLYRALGKNKTSVGSITAALAFAAALLIRAQVAFFRLQAKRGKATELMMTSLFNCAENTQEGVLLSTLRAMESEQHKEDLLVYFTLLRSRQPLSASDLDAACESLLRNLFAARVDVDIDKIVDRLKQFGLVRASSDGLLRPVSVDSAVRIMQHLASVASTLPERNACLFVKQMLVDDRFLTTEDWGIEAKAFEDNTRLVQSGWYW